VEEPLVGIIEQAKITHVVASRIAANVRKGRFELVDAISWSNRQSNGLVWGLPVSVPSRGAKHRFFMVSISANAYRMRLSAGEALHYSSREHIDLDELRVRINSDTKLP
jgi:hypothetical protein